MPITNRPALRLNDLIAKVARVTLKDTTRVLLALDAIVDFLETPADDILSQDFVVTRPAPVEVEACGDAFCDFMAWVAACSDDDWYTYLRSLD